MTLMEKLNKLKFHSEDEELKDLAETLSKKSHLDFLDKFLGNELEVRKSIAIARRKKGAKLGIFKPSINFDWNWTKGINKEEYRNLTTLQFLRDNQNIVFVGPCGVGKSMLAQNLTELVAEEGLTCRYIQASALIADLASQESSIALHRKFKWYASYRLLVIDELGYVSYNNSQSDLLFELLTRRYENSSTIITTNLAFKDWPSVFPSASCVHAMVDRFTHHCQIFKLEGESFRARDHKKNTKKGKV